MAQTRRTLNPWPAKRLAPKRLALKRLALTLLMLAVLLLGAQFIRHASVMGFAGLRGDLVGLSRLWSGSDLANWGIFGHMLMGAVITALAPLQMMPLLRARWPVLHRWSGRVVVLAALLAALGGLSYMALRGTIGGWPMTLAFSVYGVLAGLCAVQTIRHARARRRVAHRDWAVRLFFLCIASLLYRLHYAAWLGAFGRAGIETGFVGWFDRINLWAFYLPYLVAVELVLWRRGRGILSWAARARHASART